MDDEFILRCFVSGVGGYLIAKEKYLMGTCLIVWSIGWIIIKFV